MPREVAVLAAVAFAVAVGFGIVAPVIPIFARDFGVGRAAASSVISAFAFMRFVSAFSSGQLVNRIGERAVLAVGIFIVAASSALAGLAQTFTQLLVLRGIGGVGSAMFTVAAMSLLLRVAGPEQRGRATAWWQAGFLLGSLAGPAIGGLIAGVSVRAPFFVYAATLGVAGAVALAYLSRPPTTGAAAPDPTASRQEPAVSIGSALRQRAYLAALVGNVGVGWALFGVRASLIPLFVVEGLDAAPLWIGLGFVASSGAQALALRPAAWVTDLLGRRPALIAGAAVCAVSFLLVGIGSSLAVYMAAMVILGAGAGFLGVAPAAVVGDVAGSRGGTVVAVFQMAGDFGAIVGPLIAGVLADDYSYGAAFGATAAVLALAVVAALAAPETRRPRHGA